MTIKFDPLSSSRTYVVQLRVLGSLHDTENWWHQNTVLTLKTLIKILLQIQVMGLFVLFTKGASTSDYCIQKVDKKH